MAPFPWSSSNYFGGNPADFFTNPNSLALGNISITTPAAGAPGNLNGVKEDQNRRVFDLLSNKYFQGLSESGQGQLLANPGLFPSQFNFEEMIKQQGINEEKRTQMFIDAQSAAAERANEMGRENFKMANEARRKNAILDSLLQMPGQIADTLVRASTAHLPYEQEARQMMANTGANLQTGYSNLANLNNQFGNQVTNLFSNAASYRPTIAGLAGKYF
jgi:hypothetical protein